MRDLGASVCASATVAELVLAGTRRGGFGDTPAVDFLLEQLRYAAAGHSLNRARASALWVLRYALRSS